MSPSSASRRVAIAIATAAALSVSTVVRAAEPAEAGPVEATPVEPDASWGPDDEAPPASDVAPVVATPAVPPPPSPEVIELRDRQRKADKMAIGGYVVTGIGGLVCLIALPLLISARIEKNKKENFFQEAGDPEVVRTKTRIGLSMVGIGLGLAIVGATLIGVGLTRKKRHTRALEELSRPRPTAALEPVFVGADGGGFAITGRF